MNADCFRILPIPAHRDGAGSVIRNSEAGGSADISENLPAVWQAGLRPNLLEGDVYETDIL